MHYCRWTPAVLEEHVTSILSVEVKGGKFCAVTQYDIVEEY
jgi:hypothetical protein